MTDTESKEASPTILFQLLRPFDPPVILLYDATEKYYVCVLLLFKIVECLETRLSFVINLSAYSILIITILIDKKATKLSYAHVVPD